MLSKVTDVGLIAAINTVFKVYSDGGKQIFLVGGAVRDLMAGIEPKDFDFATDADFDFTHSAFDRTIDTGLQHGTITVLVDSHAFEITRFRTEREHDGRHCAVDFAETIEEDLSRRDFTFNAMALSGNGLLIDPFNGAEDLNNGRVIFVGNAEERIREDYLRILRFIRFHARFSKSGKFDQETASTIMIPSVAKGLANISRERIWSEVSRIVTGPRGPEMLTAFFWLDLARYMDLPTSNHTRIVTEAHKNGCKAPTIMAAHLGTVSGVEDLADAWKWSNDERDLANFVAWQLQLYVTLSDAKTMIAVDGVPLEHVTELFKARGRLAFVKEIESWVVPVFPIGGKDLLERGFKPSPRIGIAIKQMKKIWAMSDFAMTREELLEYF